MIQGQHVVSLQGNFTARYFYQGVENPKCLFLLLHGYSQSGEVIYKKLFDSLPSGCSVLAPNGPFPVFVSPEDSQRIGFSWYFYESRTDEYYVDMVLARHYLKTLVEKMGLGTLQKIVIGYSQGGYLAPFVAQDLPNVSQVMGLNCQFLDEELLGKWPLEMNLICGEKDEMVDPKNSKNSFDRLISKGARGKFTLVEGASHGLSTGILAEVKKALAFTQK